MTSEHHYQRVDLESGYIEATRLDCEEYQDLRIKAYTPDGHQVYKARILYNIQYDYYRMREEYYGKITYDGLYYGGTYGHLQEEYGAHPPEGWINPYPDNYEPVKKEGADKFHTEGTGLCHIFYLKNYRILINVKFYILNDLTPAYREGVNLIHDISEKKLERPHIPRPTRIRSIFPKFFLQKDRRNRIRELKRAGKYIGVSIPYNPLFID